MNKLMILAILVAYKAFNDKSLKLTVKEGNVIYVIPSITIDDICADGSIDIIIVDENNNARLRTIYVDDIVNVEFVK